MSWTAGILSHCIYSSVEEQPNKTGILKILTVLFPVKGYFSQPVAMEC